MPTLKQLLDELGDLQVEPDKLRISGQTYDEIVQKAETSSEEDQEE